MKKLLAFLFAYGLIVTPAFANWTILNVIDGDTIKIQKQNTDRIITVRMIGIDAPESSATRFGYAECFGAEAKQHLTELLSGKNLKVLYDGTQGTKDKYGRTLAYLLDADVRLDYNRQMIADGYAYEYTYKTKYKKQGIYRQAVRTAQKNSAGLRADGSCGYRNTTPVSEYGDDQLSGSVLTGTIVVSGGTIETTPTLPTTTPEVEAPKTYHRWPRGGCYRVDGGNNKQYVDASFCYQ